MSSHTGLLCAGGAEGVGPRPNIDIPPPVCPDSSSPAPPPLENASIPSAADEWIQPELLLSREKKCIEELGKNI